MTQDKVSRKAPATKFMSLMARNLSKKFKVAASVDISCASWAIDRRPKYKLYIAGNGNNFWRMSNWRDLVATYNKLMKAEDKDDV